MKTQVRWTALWVFLVLTPLFGQAQYRPVTGSFGVDLNPFFYQTVRPTDSFTETFENRWALQLGLNGEAFLRDRLSLRATLRYRSLEEEFIVPTGQIFFPVSYRTIQRFSHLTHLSLGLRGYGKAQKKALESYIGAGLDLEAHVAGTEQKPFHPDPEISNQINPIPFHLSGMYGFLEGGMRYRMHRHVATEVGMLVRFPFSRHVIRSAHFGLSASLIYLFSK